MNDRRGSFPLAVRLAAVELEASPPTEAANATLHGSKGTRGMTCCG